MVKETLFKRDYFKGGLAVGESDCAELRKYQGQVEIDRCMVRPLKMAVLLLSVHALLDQSLLHSHDYPILLIIGLINQ